MGDVGEPQIPACQGLARQVRGAPWLTMANLIKQVRQLGHHVWMLLRHRFEPGFILVADGAVVVVGKVGEVSVKAKFHR